MTVLRGNGRAWRVPVAASAGLLALTLAAPARADIYKFVDAAGRVHLTDRPPHAGYRLVMRTRRSATPARIDYRALERNRRRFAPLITANARRQRLPAALLYAMVHVESAYDPQAVSRAGAIGLMQLMPDTARRYGVRNPRDPRANLYAGARHLRELLVRFDNDLVLALAAYNAGERAVRKAGYRVPPFPETRHYVRRVLERYREYRRLL